MLRRTISAFATVFTLIFIATFSPIIPHFNRRRRKNAPETSSCTAYRPYRIPLEDLEKHEAYDDHSFDRNNHDDFVDFATLEREHRVREEIEEMERAIRSLLHSAHEDLATLIDGGMSGYEKLMSREGNEDAFFNRRYIAPRTIDSKIVTRNINARYIGRKPMINRPVAHKTRRQRAVF